jgi:ribosome-associated heat shock protein Hsp15
LSELRGLRIDKWLFFARFIRSRALAIELIGERRVRVNEHVIEKTHHLVRPGDVVTLRQPGAVRVVRVVALGQRRGPATEARALYAEILIDA